MSDTQGQDRRASAKSGFLEQLHNPSQLRAFLIMAVLGIGYGAVYMPLENNIAATTKKLREAKKRLGLAGDVEKLRKQFAVVKSRLPKQADANEFLQYILAGIRRSPLKLDSLVPSKPQAIDPYQIVVLKLKLSGAYADLDQFLHWLDSNDRLFRVESIRVAPASRTNSDDLNMEITVLGLLG